MQTNVRQETTTLVPFATSLLCAAICVGLSSSAYAQGACAPTVSEPTDVAIEKSPDSVLDCVTVSVQGQWYCGAEPLVVFRNDCSNGLRIDDSSFRCGGVGEREECSSVSPDSVGSTELHLESEEGFADTGTSRHETTYDTQVGEESGTVTVTFDVTRTESGDSGGCVESDNAQPTGTVVGLFVPFLLCARIRRHGTLLDAA